MCTEASAPRSEFISRELEQFRSSNPQMSVEAALRPACAALPPRLRRRAAAALLRATGALPELAAHPKASWVVAAAWDALQGGRPTGRRAAMRAEFHAQLAAAPSLRAENPRLWQRLGLGDA